MRRLLRWTFNTLAAASLLLCLATAGLWVRSYWVGEEFSWYDMTGSGGSGRPRSDTVAIFLVRGGVMVQSRHEQWGDIEGFLRGGHGFLRSRGFPAAYPLYAPRYWSYQQPARRFHACGFEIVCPLGELPRFAGYAERTTSITIPLAALVCVTAALPVAWLGRTRRLHRRRHRSRLGLCPACGYDLRASPERCPECGAAPAKSRG